MKLKFKKQAYQTLAVESLVNCFKGQSKTTGINYRIDPGIKNTDPQGADPITYDDQGNLNG